MQDGRQPFYDPADLDELYPTGNNPIWQAYNREFEEMFKYRDVKLDTGWYVAERMDAGTGKPIPEQWTPEKQMVKFIHSEAWPEPERLVLVHGGIGHGKTTFVRYFFEIYLAKRYPEIFKRLIYLYVDCSKSAVSAGDLEEDFDHKLSDVLNTQLKDTKGEAAYKVWKYHPEFPIDVSRQEQDKWIADAKSPQPGRQTPSRYSAWNTARLRYLLKEQDTFLTIVLDNIDQAEREVQRRSVALARHKLDWWCKSKDPEERKHLQDRVILILCIREYLVRKIESSSPTNAFRDRKLRLHPPDIYAVLRLRRDDAVHKLKKVREESREAISLSEDKAITVQTADAERFLDEVLREFKLPETKKILLDLSNKNVRYQMDFVECVLRSGLISYENVRDFMYSYYEAKDRKKVARPWLFGPGKILQALLSPTNAIYSKEDSPIINIWDANTKGFCNTLNHLCILKLVDLHRSMDQREICNKLKLLGHSKSVTRLTLQRLLSAQLLESEDGMDVEKDKIKLVHLTRSGKFYVDELIKKVYYVEQLAWVTPLSSVFLDNIREGLKTHTGLESHFVAAAQLLSQIAEDTAAQLEYVNRTNGEAKAVVEELGLERVPSEIAEHIQAGIDEIAGYVRESDRERWSNIKSMLKLSGKFISARPIISMERETAFIVVKKAACAPLYRSTVVDMIAVLDDVEADRMLEAVYREYQNLRKRYPVAQYDISEVYGDEFAPLSQEARFINYRSVRQKLASECLHSK